MGSVLVVTLALWGVSNESEIPKRWYYLWHFQTRYHWRTRLSKLCQVTFLEVFTLRSWPKSLFFVCTLTPFCTLTKSQLDTFFFACILTFQVYIGQANLFTVQHYAKIKSVQWCVFCLIQTMSYARNLHNRWHIISYEIFKNITILYLQVYILNHHEIRANNYLLFWFRFTGSWVNLRNAKNHGTFLKTWNLHYVHFIYIRPGQNDQVISRV